jgi:NTP pyrophosphatase (non-canonical NTP hydrolase)
MRAFWEARNKWSERTFGEVYERNPLGPIRHLKKEIDEELLPLAEQLYESQTGDRDKLYAALKEEIVDALFLVFDAAMRACLSYDDLEAAAWRKLVKNEQRKWPKPTKDQPVEHDRSWESGVLAPSRTDKLIASELLAVYGDGGPDDPGQGQADALFGNPTRRPAWEDTVDDAKRGCIWDQAWVGPCKAPTTFGQLCTKHVGKACVGCGKQAVRECPEAGSLVCGAPLCKACRHTYENCRSVHGPQEVQA